MEDLIIQFSPDIKHLIWEFVDPYRLWFSRSVLEELYDQIPTYYHTEQIDYKYIHPHHPIKEAWINYGSRNHFPKLVHYRKRWWMWASCRETIDTKLKLAAKFKKRMKIEWLRMKKWKDGKRYHMKPAQIRRWIKGELVS